MNDNMCNKKQTEIINLFLQALYTEPEIDAIKVGQEIKKIIGESGRLNDLISPIDVDGIYVDLRNQKSLKAISDDEVRKYVEIQLFITKKFGFYFPIYRLIDYPDNYQIGYCIVKQFNSLPPFCTEIF